MGRVVWMLVVIGAAHILFPGSSAPQCSSRVTLTDSTYIYCEGRIYGDCEVELEVNNSGLWLNDELMDPFVQFVDHMHDSEKKFYRTTNVYRRAASFGADDRQGLIAASKAELSAIDRLRELTAGVHSRDELQNRMPEVLADSLVSDFVADVIWSEDLEIVGYRAVDCDSFVFLGELCGVSPGSVPNSRDWEEYLPYLLETFCKQLESAKRLETIRTYGCCVAVMMGNVSGATGARSKAELFEKLKK